MRGRIIKGIGGFYFVSRVPESYEIFMCKARGRLKAKNNILYVGDYVEFEKNENHDEYVITKIYDRRNYLIRPPVSNIDMIIIVAASKDPLPNYLAIDKLALSCSYKGIDVTICINKSNSASEEELLKIRNIYKPIYPYIETDMMSNYGLEDLYNLIKGKSVAFAGASGVGKSTITNKLIEISSLDFAHKNKIEKIIGDKRGEYMKTGNLSDKTKRGKHTTRHSEIIILRNETMLFDTPGFTSIEPPKMDKYMVKDYFPEFRKLTEGECKFKDCLHINEPECVVKRALEEGNISKRRYNSYLNILEYEEKLSNKW